jgi:hypothetical protein
MVNDGGESDKGMCTSIRSLVHWKHGIRWSDREHSGIERERDRGRGGDVSVRVTRPCQPGTPIEAWRTGPRNMESLEGQRRGLG